MIGRSKGWSIKPRPLVRDATDWCLTALYGTMDLGRGRFILVGNHIGRKFVLASMAERPHFYHMVVNVLDKKGKPTWHQNYTLGEVNAMRVEMGERRFQKEYMNNPITEGTVFEKKDIRYGKMLPLRQYRSLVCYTDPSFKSGPSNDYKATLLVGITDQGAYHVLKAYADQTKVSTTGITKGVTYSAPDDVYQMAMEQNLFHFSAAKTLAEVQELNYAFRASKIFNNFKDKAAQITDTFNKNWQRTEYNTAVQVAESASSYRRMKSNTDLFLIWVYRTVGDGQVRPEHASLDGTTLPANDPAWSEIYPPNDWGCRCWVEAVMAGEHEGRYAVERQRVREFMRTTEWKRAVAQGWGVNCAQTAQVFTANQMYIKKFPDKASKLLGGLYSSDNGLRSFGKCLQEATEVFVEYSGKAVDWLAENSYLKDYSGKSIVLSEKSFKRHTTGKYEAIRVPLLNTIPVALKAPDEVWINNYKKGVIILIISNIIRVRPSMWFAA